MSALLWREEGRQPGGQHWLTGCPAFQLPTSQAIDPVRLVGSPPFCPAAVPAAAIDQARQLSP
ncbi:hypothetical protein A4R35_03660 [Thermogemmatispora tikiterensis]|uniref:Uncharacterized protein n=1 Tax=Thermogemmatispora tikiterensis TaxID=1825093 RepID=A0A328VAH1_9CHLR|nr:hypothetical protein A4R35_03660 [Thermogemmatispora tikiterensis]